MKKNKYNNFDNLRLNVKVIYKNYPIGSEKITTIKGSSYEAGIFPKIYGFILLPLSIRNYLWYFFHRTELDVRWLSDFKVYWRQILGGITLWGPQDFYFLRNIYRQKFQSLSLPDSNDLKKHLRAWQRPEVLYQLLDMVYRNSLFNQYEAVKLYLQFKPVESHAVYEFGCGTGPVADSFLDFFKPTGTRIYLSDIETIFFHYAAFKFRNDRRVVPIALKPEEKFMPRLPEKVGAIFCLTVYEHLTEPLTVTKNFFDLLIPGGILIFDYLKSEGKGMDTKAALKSREQVLDYVSQKFEIVSGLLHQKGDQKIIVARKRYA